MPETTSPEGPDRAAPAAADTVSAETSTVPAAVGGLRWRELLRGATDRPLRRELLWVVPAAVLVAGTLAANKDAAPAAFTAAGVLGGLAGGAVLLALGRARVAVLINGLALGGYYLIGLADGPIFVTVPLVAFVAAQREYPRRLLPFLGSGLAAVTLGLALRSVVHDAPGWETGWQVVGSCALSLAAGSLGWWLLSRREVRAEQARRVATEEQLRMAQDLHDGVGHGLAMIAVQAGVALHLLDRDPAEARRSLELIRATCRESLDALRAELARVGSSESAPRRPEHGLADLGTLLDRVRSGGLAVELTTVPGPLGRFGSVECPIDAATDAVAYAVVQESLTNVLRHAGAHSARLDLHLLADTLTITVTDDGTGRAGTSDDHGAGRRDDNGGMGLSGMRSRVTRLGGSLEAGPTATGGWRVHAVLPVATGAP